MRLDITQIPMKEQLETQANIIKKRIKPKVLSVRIKN